MSSGGSFRTPERGIDALPVLLLQRLRVGLWTCLVIYLGFGAVALADGNMAPGSGGQSR